MHAGAYISTDKPHDRLAFALVISTCAIVSGLQMLAPLLGWVSSVPGAGTERIDVLVLQSDRSPTPAAKVYSHPIPSQSASESLQLEDSSLNPGIRRDKVAPVPTDPQAPNSLDQLVADAIEANLDSTYRQEPARKSQWQKSRSVVFERPSNFSAAREEPLIPDFRFKPEIHVAGIGLTIGSCFIGIPLVGIPVEERTVAFRPIVCARPDT